MSIESISNFTEQLLRDESLLREISGEVEKSIRESSIAGMARVARKHGYLVTLEEIEMFEQFLAEQCADVKELGNGDLAKVAGGAGCSSDPGWIEPYRTNYQGIFEDRLGMKVRRHREMLQELLKLISGRKH